MDCLRSNDGAGTAGTVSPAERGPAVPDAEWKWEWNYGRAAATISELLAEPWATATTTATAGAARWLGKASKRKWKHHYGTASINTRPTPIAHNTKTRW